MWYENSRNICFSKPIMAERNDGTRYLLVPQLDNNEEYEYVGYNWLILETGMYNSNCNFKTAEEAMQSYNHCKFYNIKEFVI